MTLTPVLTLDPHVTREEAIRAFSHGPSALLWRLRNGALQSVAEAYVPYWGYRVQYIMAGVPHTRYFALDAVTGSLDPFEFPRLPAPLQLVPVSSKNFLAAALTAGRAEALLREKVLRVIFLQGFFKLRGGKIDIAREDREFHIPYWLGFYANSGSVRCRVLDAVRRRIEGAKATDFFEQWLAA
jgi:hypothetical protein